MQGTVAYIHAINSVAARYTDPLLVQCCVSVADADTTLNQHFASASCLLGCDNNSNSVLGDNFDLMC